MVVMSRAGFAAAPADAAAFCDFLTTLSAAVKLRMDGGTLAASITQMEANAAAFRAFPLGSPESEALGLLLVSALRVTAVVTL